MAPQRSSSSTSPRFLSLKDAAKILGASTGATRAWLRRYNERNPLNPILRLNARVERDSFEQALEAALAQTPESKRQAALLRALETNERPSLRQPDGGKTSWSTQ